MKIGKESMTFVRLKNVQEWEQNQKPNEQPKERKSEIMHTRGIRENEEGLCRLRERGSREKELLNEGGGILN